MELRSAAEGGQASAKSDGQSADELFALVYDELRRMARRRMAGEAAGHTLQPTALVNEAWLRIGALGGGRFENRAHFFAAAGEAMRRILVDSARRRNSQKRGGAEPACPLSEQLVEQKAPGAPTEEMLAVDEWLEFLEQQDHQAAELVKLRYFVGLTTEEAAEALGISVRTAGRLWTFARAWLRSRIQRAPP